MIEKRTVMDQIEITANGTVLFRLAKLIVEDGTVLAREWHRSVIEPSGDVDAQMAAVNAHLVEMGAAECTDYAALKAHVGLARTLAAPEATAQP
jgi:hypothetical protein